MKCSFLTLWIFYCMASLKSHGSDVICLENEEFMQQCNVINATLYNGMFIRRDASGVRLFGSFTAVDGVGDLQADMSNDQFYQELLKLSPVYQLTFGESITQEARLKEREVILRRQEHQWQEKLANLIALYKL